mgnify:CR=1 FL=1
MPRSRIPVNISFPTSHARDEARRKADQRGRTLSGQIQWYFENLSSLDDNKPNIDGAAALFKDAIGSQL